jgi:hypothetical protein
MAFVLPTVLGTNYFGDNAKTVVWVAANGDSGSPYEMRQQADRSVQIAGTFGAGGSVNVEGSNDGTNYQILRDPQGVALTFTAAGLKQVLEITNYIRPRVTAGDGTTALTITLLARGNS